MKMSVSYIYIKYTCTHIHKTWMKDLKKLASLAYYWWETVCDSASTTVIFFHGSHSQSWLHIRITHMCLQNFLKYLCLDLSPVQWNQNLSNSDTDIFFWKFLNDFSGQPKLKISISVKERVKYISTNCAFFLCLWIKKNNIWTLSYFSIRSNQISRSVVSDSLRPHESQHARPPCPLPTPGVHSDSHTSSQWCHPAISSSVVPFSSCPKSFPASESFQWVNSSHEVAKVLEFQL